MTKEKDSLKLESLYLREQLLKQETFSRRKNLRIRGPIESNQDSLEQKVLQVFNEVGLSLLPRDIERIHFLGPQRKKHAKMYPDEVSSL